jgi:hypothetical protein
MAAKATEQPWEIGDIAKALDVWEDGNAKNVVSRMSWPKNDILP